MQFPIGLKNCCEHLSLHRPSPSWGGETPAAGADRHGVAECGTGKTLISLVAIHVHGGGSLFAALVTAWWFLG
jgi:hypothetical protein